MISSLNSFSNDHLKVLKNLKKQSIQLGRPIGDEEVEEEQHDLYDSYEEKEEESNEEKEEMMIGFRKNINIYVAQNVKLFDED